MRYLLSDIDMGEEEVNALADVVRSKWLSLGPRTEAFEQRFAEVFGVKHAIAVSSCTASLHLALAGCGIGPGDEVLVPSYTFVASVNAVVYVGARPVFVDIGGPHDLNLSVDDLEAKITPRTAAILPVHIAGFAAELDRVMAIAERHGLVVVEDACHAIGARYEGAAASLYAGRKLGTLGTAGCFSFFANKNMTTGEGGMIVTNDSQLATYARRCRSHGMTKLSWDRAYGRAVDYDVVSIGYNYRCTELTAALGLVQLAKLEGGNRKRRQLTDRYRRRLKGCPGITLPFGDRLDDSGCHVFPILIEGAEHRPLLRERLRARGIQTSVHYPPAHLFSHYRKLAPNPQGLERTVEVAAREITLPLHPLLCDRDVDIICKEVLVAAEEIATREPVAL